MPIPCLHNLSSQLGFCFALPFLGCTATAARLKGVMLGNTRGMRAGYCEPFWRGLAAPVVVNSLGGRLTLLQAHGLQRNHVRRWEPLSSLLSQSRTDFIQNLMSSKTPLLSVSQWSVQDSFRPTLTRVAHRLSSPPWLEVLSSLPAWFSCR